MNKSERKYFENLSKSVKPNYKEGGAVSHFDYPLMPDQYSYVHNLATGQFESVRGVKEVLGYDNDEFTLDLYYDRLHPLDRKLIFETTKRNIDTANELRMFEPFGCQMTILFRIKKSTGEFAKIIRFSTVLNSQNNIVKTLSICTDITKLGLINDVASAFTLKGVTPYDNQLLINQLKKTSTEKLSPREMQIVELIAHGNTTLEISESLSISPYTVNKHRQNILRKTNCKNIQELIKESFIRNGKFLFNE